MHRPFLALFRFSKRNPWSFRLILLLVLALMIWRALGIRFDEDVSRFFPKSEEVQKFNEVFQHSRMAERLVVMVSVADSSTLPQPDTLVQAGQELSQAIGDSLGNYIGAIKTTVDDAGIGEVIRIIQGNLPVFLDEADYRELEELTDHASVPLVLRRNYEQLISPAGLVTKNVIAKDPLGISFLVLRKLQRLQYDENFVLYDNFILTRDYRHLIFFIQPAQGVNESRESERFLGELETILATTNDRYPKLSLTYFGGPRVAAGNARQLRADTVLTLTIMVVALTVFLMAFFRRKRIPLIILIPVFCGAVFALACISFIQPALSVLALAVGAVILGIAVDYSLHFLVHLKYGRDTESAIRELAKPLTIGSMTTVIAFLGLQLTNASVLRDIGLFAAFSLLGAALSALVILPHLLDPKALPLREGRMFRNLYSLSFESKRPLVYLILALTPVFLYFAGDVTFNSDLSRLNFMTDDTRAAQRRLEAVTQGALSSVYVVSSGVTFEEVLRRSERVVPVVDSLHRQGSVRKFSTVSTFLISDSLQDARIRRWNAFWDADRVAGLRAVVGEEARKLGFSDLVLKNADSLLTRRYSRLSAPAMATMRDNFFRDLIIERDTSVTVISLLTVDPENRAEVYAALARTPADAFDRQTITNLFVEYVHADFNFIVTFTSVLVFVALLVVYGRIELTLVTFLPMLVSWIWILGIMALAGIEFNIVNVMVSTFIFGLGDDYSIFIMDGLQQEHSRGRRSLGFARVSVFLSAVTTLCGLGVLVFARHPALVSIAAIAIIGIACVFVMSVTLEPFFFRVLVTDRTARSRAPMTAKGIVVTVLTYAFFAAGSVFLTIVGLMLRLIPFGRGKVQLFFHRLICGFNRVLLRIAFNLDIRRGGQRGIYDHPAVIVANHSSFLDILLLTSENPRVILLTNSWVWNSPVFGGVVRLAGYYPVNEGAEGGVEHLARRVREGYSIVVFPEGSRSADGGLRRFHKGAFYLAEQLGLPVRPLLIANAHEGIPKGSWYVNDTTIGLKYLEAIDPQDNAFGETYSERAKHIGRYFRARHEAFAASLRTPANLRRKLISGYLYKGPVLEWYLRVKLALEKNYEKFDWMIPRDATVLDLGCGYGFLTHMLSLLGPGRKITGVDFDEEKVGVAQHVYFRTADVNFACADVTKYPISGRYDAIVISDVLHYLDPRDQEELLVRCFSALNAGGRLIVRDGNRDLAERHRGTRITEFFSVRLLGFNKTRNKLSFISGDALRGLAETHGFSVSVDDETRFTSNVIFVISKEQPVHAAI